MYVAFLLSCLPPWIFLQLEKCAQDLGSTSKAVGSSMAQLLTCAAQGNEHYTGETHILRDVLWPGAAGVGGGGQPRGFLDLAMNLTLFFNSSLQTFQALSTCLLLGLKLSI